MQTSILNLNPGAGSSVDPLPPFRSHLRSVRGSTWHRIYGLLAAFAGLTFALNLYLSHQITSCYTRAVESNEGWIMRLNEVSLLGDLARQMVEASRHIFDYASPEVAGEMTRPAAYLFDERVVVLKREFNEAGQIGAANLIKRLNAVQESAHAMSAQIESILARARKSKPQWVLKEIGKIDLMHEKVQNNLARLREDIAMIQSRQFVEEKETASSFHRIGYLAGILVFLLVAGTAYYGYKLANKAEGDAREKEHYLARLQESQDRYRDLFENAVEGVFQSTPDGRFTRVNPALARIFGYDSPGEMIAKLTSVEKQLYVASERRAEFARLLEEQGSVTAFESQVYKKNGSIFWISESARGVRDRSGHLLTYEGFIIDITRRKQAETDLRESEEKFSSLTDSAQDAVVVIDHDGRITVWNKAAQKMFGYTSDEILGKELHPLLAPAEYHSASQEGLRTFQATGHGPAVGQTLELRAINKDRKIFPIELSLSTVRLRSQWHAMGILRDVTQRKLAEQMKSDFVSFATHQLRTPLAGIKWLLELAAEGAESAEEVQSFVADARASADRLIHLVNDLLDVSRLEQGKIKLSLQNVNLQTTTLEVLDDLRPLALEKQQRLTMAKNGTVPPVLADAQLIRQVVLNLISNAIKYSPPGGDISIEMRLGEDTLAWQVKDAGIGIPKEALGRMFEKFYRAENALAIATEGTGLGLYLARLIVERLGGTVGCESELGKGATFKFTLPLAA